MLEATSVIQEDNAQVRVTRWQLPAGGHTGFHVHEMDYVIVPLNSGPLTIAAEDGSRSQAMMSAGESYCRPAGVAHNVINEGPGEIIFVEVELKESLTTG